MVDELAAAGAAEVTSGEGAGAGAGVDQAAGGAVQAGAVVAGASVVIGAAVELDPCPHPPQDQPEDPPSVAVTVTTSTAVV